MNTTTELRKRNFRLYRSPNFPQIGIEHALVSGQGATPCEGTASSITNMFVKNIVVAN
ncbi:MAG: hypothetical protein QOG96_1538 [Pseudonocardiales bacterium]|jgi:hypothetical protein|nr:hypothetical protein [Pseudonocardiales bacterium]